MAYIALDRFRYSKKALDIIIAAKKAITVPEGKDSAITTLNRKYEDIRKNGIYTIFGYAFGTEETYGWAYAGVVISLIVQFIVFSCVIYLGEEVVLWCFLCVSIVGIMGTIYPACLICVGNKAIKKLEKEIGDIVSDVKNTHGYENSISGISDLKFEEPS